jgi:4-amino-4-deoxy-L-arabinose transferase-like glycosyltransferase
MTLRDRGALSGILLLFVLTAILFIRRPGIEADEALVGNPAIFSFHHVPLMLMSYMGALKAWLYLAIFSFVRPDAISLRLPTVLIGAWAVWLFFLLLDRTLGRRAAWIGALLMATDTMFVILEAIDFGPTALHFVLKLGALLLLLRFHREGAIWALAAGFFLFGLGLWDKAIFAWVIFGIGAATVVVFPREIWRHVTAGNVGIAAAALLVGAAPLIFYNVARPLDTWKSNVHMVREPVYLKSVLLERTMNGAAFFGFFTSIEVPPKPGEASTLLLRLSREISKVARHPTHNLTIEAFALAWFGLFARASRKAVLFGILACAGTWVPMLLTAGAGAGAHHVLLLWPFHFLAIAAALAAIPFRWVALVATAILCAANLAVTNEYYWELAENGPAIRWTSAIYPLETLLESLRSPNIYIVDWNITETLHLLSDGGAPLESPDWSNAEKLRAAVADPRAVFVAHTPPYEYFPQQRVILEDAAAGAGYEEVPVKILYDRNGRATFDVFRFRKIPL